MFVAAGGRKFAQPNPSPAFPLKASGNGRYLVDQHGVPFRIHGFAFWDGHITLTRADWQTALSALAGQGINAVHTYLCNSVPYYTGGPQPKNNAGALPFTLNASGGSWNGDPTFANHDAALDSANDSYFATVAQFVDDCAALGILVIAHPLYAGAHHTTVGDDDGWWQTLVNSHNTTSVCTTYGAYLANGHGTFTGFAASTRPNIIWIMQGDSGIGDSTIGSAGSTRHQAIFTALAANGATQLVTQHVTHDNLPSDMTDYKSFYGLYACYSEATTGEIYSECRAVFAQAPTLPTFKLEDPYFGDAGASSTYRYGNWGAALTTMAGNVTSFSPMWGWFVSPDGSGQGVTLDCQPNCWQASTTYKLNNRIHLGGNWYKCITAGQSAASGGPSGTGSNITDNTAHWAYVTTVSASLGGMANLFGEPGLVYHQVLGQILGSLPWWRLIPSGLNGMGAIISSGNGTQTAFSDGSVPSGTADWIVSAATTEGDCIVAYVPTGHSGSFSVNTALLTGAITAKWYDPTTGAWQSAGASPFTTPGNNAGGDGDWVLVMTTGKQSVWL